MIKEKQEEWVYLDSISIAEILEYRHDRILGKIRNILERNLLQPNTSKVAEIHYYINSQNKKQPYYKMCEYVATELLKSCNRKNYTKVKEYLESTIVATKHHPKIIAENQFYNMIANIFPELKIEKQYSILNYFIDFYIVELNLFVELDEKHHQVCKNKAQDRIREIEILSFAHVHINQDISFMRVNEDDVYTGVRYIMDLLHKMNL